MKTHRCLATLAAVLLAGCSTNEPVTTAQTGATSDQARRTYSQERLKSTGENTVGEGLAKTDPSVRIAGGR